MSRTVILAALAAALACSGKDPGAAPRPRTVGLGAGAACLTDVDCPATQWCLHYRCSDRPTPDAPPTPPTAAWSVSPEVLNFGTVTAGNRRRLTLVVSNTGEVPLTLAAWRVVPAGAAFAVEPLGYGPFWIRPGRSRDLFVTFAPEQPGHVDATLLLGAEAPELSVPLIGN